MVISGGTSTGKTTLLNIVSSYLGNDERILTIEDSAELQLQQEHVVRLEARPPNVEGRGQVTIRQLVINALRMRPDRIVVGEVRGGEALDMLQAMNTGHDGSLTTAHSNTPRDTLARVETMVLMAGMDLPLRAIREQIASAFDVIVHLERLPDGQRKITQISEVQGMEGDVIIMQDIFRFVQTASRTAGCRATSPAPASGRSSWTRSRRTASTCRPRCSRQRRSADRDLLLGAVGPPAIGLGSFTFVGGRRAPNAPDRGLRPLDP